MCTYYFNMNKDEQRLGKEEEEREKEREREAEWLTALNFLYSASLEKKDRSVKVNRGTEKWPLGKMRTGKGF